MNPPLQVEDLLAELGSGENGFGGTPVASGESTLEEFLLTSAMTSPANQDQVE